MTDIIAAVRGITDDYMTSEAHHPGYVLIPTERFDMLRAAEASLASAPAGDAVEAAIRRLERKAAPEFGVSTICDRSDLRVVLDALARPRAAVGERYLVWSNEHQAWWGPEHRGYTRHIERAGRYDRAEAMSIAGTRDGGWHVRKGNPDEIAIPEHDAVEQYAAITAALALQSPPAKVEG